MRFWVRICCILFTLGFSLAAQTDQKLVEKMEVTNVSVQARVFYRGKVVKNLKKSDFTIYEGGEVQKIHGFFRVKNKIGTHQINITTGPQKQFLSDARYFVLVFRVTQFTPELRKGIDYFFDKILEKNDDLLVFINNKTLFLSDPLYSLFNRKDILIETLKEQALIANNRLLQYFMEVEKELNATELDLLLEQDQNFYPPRIILFLERYLQSWKDYKKKYLVPDIDAYFNFAHYLEKINKEKWIINFYQVEMFPKMKLMGRLRIKIEDLIGQLLAARSEDYVHSRIIRKLLNKITKELNAVADFPFEQMNKLFYKVNASFSTIFLRRSKDVHSENLEFRKVSSDIENCFRELTKSTGGKLIVSNDVSSALHQITKRENYYYLLTYAPNNPKTIGQIKIKMKNPKYKVVYDNNLRADYISDYLAKQLSKRPQVRLKHARFKNKKLCITMENFFQNTIGKTREGKLSVKVLVKNQNNEVFYDEKRIIIAKKDRVRLEVDFNWLKKDVYFLIVEVEDFYTKKTASHFFEKAVD